MFPHNLVAEKLKEVMDEKDERIAQLESSLAEAKAEIEMWKRPLVCHWCEEPVPEEEYCTHWKTCENSPARAELAEARRENERLRNDLVYERESSARLSELAFDLNVEKKSLREALIPLASAQRARWAFADSSSSPYVVTEGAKQRAKDALKAGDDKDYQT